MSVLTFIVTLFALSTGMCFAYLFYGVGFQIYCHCVHFFIVIYGNCVVVTPKRVTNVIVNVFKYMLGLEKIQKLSQYYYIVIKYSGVLTK